jgi:hypothetical protein
MAQKKKQESITSFCKLTSSSPSTSEFNSTHNNDTSTNKRASSPVNSIDSVKICRTLSLDINDSINDFKVIEDTNYSNNYDIGFYTNRMLSNEDIVIVMTRIWMPNISYKFPPKLYTVQNKPKYLKYSWLLRFPWLVYSIKENGAFCRICVAFSKSNKNNGPKLRCISKKKKYDNWRNTIVDFKKHSNKGYHKMCVLSSDHFIDVIKHPGKSITCKIETGRAEQIRKNRKNISPIIQTVILCGRQNIPLRGHRDSEKLIVEQENVKLIQNQGNFREIL